jgi:hypothetical protein
MDLEKFLKKYDVDVDERKLTAFGEVVFNRRSYKDAGHVVKVQAATVGKWAKEQWWKDANEEFIKSTYKRLKEDAIVKGAEAIPRLIDDVVNSDTDKTAAAKAGLVKTLLSMTDDPGIKQGGRADVNINMDNRTVNIGDSVDMDKVRYATIEEKKEIARGIVPEHFLKEKD